MGVLALSFAIELAFPAVNNLMHSSSWGRLLYFVFFVGLVEEFSKLLAARIFLYPRRDFREAWDGLAGSTAVALGFATAENIKYVLMAGDPYILLPRSVMSTTGHILMSGIWGYALGISRAAAIAPKGRNDDRVRRWVLPALLTSALGHGTYDFFLFQNLPWLAVGVLGLLWAVFWSQVKDSVQESQRRLTRSFPVRECRECHTLLRSDYRFCTHCGREVDPGSKVYCQNCLNPTGHLHSLEHASCGHCGAVWR